ncbi:MAG: hypothetical protein ACRDOP_16690 [Gaiellaceae bacterium]
MRPAAADRGELLMRERDVVPASCGCKRREGENESRALASDQQESIPRDPASAIELDQSVNRGGGSNRGVGALETHRGHSKAIRKGGKRGRVHG